MLVWVFAVLLAPFQLFCPSSHRLLRKPWASAAFLNPPAHRVGTALAQQPPAPPPAPAADQRSKKPEIVILDPNAPKGLEKDKEEKPKEKEKPAEIEEAAPRKEYAYNPYQAEKEVEVGNFYMKKGNYTAAILRYEEATKWKPNWGLPYLKLGQAYEKNGEAHSAAEAYRKYLEILPKDKRAGQVRKEIARLEREAGK